MNVNYGAIKTDKSNKQIRVNIMMLLKHIKVIIIMHKTDKRNNICVWIQYVLDELSSNGKFQFCVPLQS